MNYSNGRMWDEYDKAMSRITDLEEELEKANARAAELQAALDATINMNIEKNAEIINLTAALAAANEDSARLASSLENDAYPFPIRRSIDEKDAALRAHRARVGGGS